MNIWTSLLFTFTLPLTAANLPALNDTPSFDDVLDTPLEPPTVTPSFFQIDGRGDWIQPSTLQVPRATIERLGFAETDARAGYVFPCGCAMYSVAAGYQKTWITLENVYLFDRTDFQNAYVTLGGKVFEGDWTYQGEFQFNADVDLGGKRCYLYFYGGWATYAYLPCLSMSAGFIGRSGLRQDKFWPVLGFEWNINSQWEIHAVYPVNISVLYRPIKPLAIGLTTRFINSRHRLNKDDIIPSGILEYRNAGEELGITYSPAPFFSINGHVGYMFRPDLQISNTWGEVLTDLKADGSFYAGGNILFRF